jgi:hypothetical protein
LSVFTLALGMVGCAAETPDYTADADTGSTQALVTIDRAVDLDAPDALRAEAFAGIVQAPPEVDPATVMRLAQLGLELPDVGQCAVPARDGASSIPMNPTSRVEFLEAGDVSLKTSELSASLAPRAFPAFTDRISGVVYTTRDRTAEPLPAGTRYELFASGSFALPAFSMAADAPPPLSEIQIQGLPVEEIAAVSPRDPLLLSWIAGNSGDLVYFEAADENGVASLVCTFRDDAGGGTVPASSIALTGSGSLSLHRVRTVPFQSPGVDAGEVRFDFQVVTHVDFSGG